MTYARTCVRECAVLTLRIVIGGSATGSQYVMELAYRMPSTNRSCHVLHHEAREWKQNKASTLAPHICALDVG